MEEGEWVEVSVDGKTAKGKAIKTYTQIGFEDHGKKIAVILLEDSHLRFYEAEIKLMNPNN
jgi:hypothetical protein